MTNKKGWEIKKLGDLYDVRDGTHDSPKFVEDGYALITSKNLKNDTLNYNNVNFITEQDYIKINKRSKVDIGDILFAMIGTIGNSIVVKDEPNFAIKNVALFKIPKCQNSYFLKYYLDSKSVIEKMYKDAKGATQKFVGLSYLRHFKIPFPPLSIQEHIVSELDTLSDIISKKKQQLADLDTLAQATFYDMFGDPVSNENGWEVSKLETLGSFKNGLNYKTSENGINIKILSVSDFKKNITLRNTESLGYVGLDIEPNVEYFLKENDIIFVRSNGSKDLVGRCILMGLIKEKITFSGFCIRFRMMIHKLNPLFLTYVFTNSHFKSNLIQQGRGANISNINQQMLSEQIIIMPPISLQKQFSERIASIEHQKELIKKSIEDVQQLFDGTMERYFN